MCCCSILIDLSSDFRRSPCTQMQYDINKLKTIWIDIFGFGFWFKIFIFFSLFVAFASCRLNSCFLGFFVGWILSVVWRSKREWNVFSILYIVFSTFLCSFRILFLLFFRIYYRVRFACDGTTLAYVKHKRITLYLLSHFSVRFFFFYFLFII